YQWEVNKVNQHNKAGTFTWKVPDEKGIWEIHLACCNEKGEAHQEWVVSTLSGQEAPDLFEYFTDGRFRDRSGTDPWGRPLREWRGEEGYQTPEVVRRWVEPPAGRVRYTLRTDSETAYGTWKLWFRFPMGYFVPPNGGSGPGPSSAMSLLEAAVGTPIAITRYLILTTPCTSGTIRG
ncbi:MAG: hypothetical protein KAT86_08165, partial [Candidatus Latescibacteria bacterium]|nr:hypothetical protein [Candidatus Latescibacterota bacterium]